MPQLITITDETFAERVLGSESPILVDYWATWCGPCRMLRPVLAEIAAEQAGRLRIGLVDTDVNPHTVLEQRIMATPTMILYVGGAPVTSMVGARTKFALLRAIEPYLDHPVTLPGNVAAPAASS